MLKYPLTILVAVVFCLTTLQLRAQIQIDTTLTPEQLVQNVLLGNGVSVSNITFNGQPGTTLNTQTGKYIGPSNFIDFNSGVCLMTAHAFTIQDPAFFPPFFNYPDPDITSDSDLEELCGQDIHNAAILEFDFVPNGDSLVFRYVFASKEYPGYTCSEYNDSFGFFISGPGINGTYQNNAINIALIPDSDIPVGINTVNSGTASGGFEASTCEAANPNWIEDSQYFVDNSAVPEGDIQFPGMTTTLTAFANVECGQTYHIKLAIADATDGSFDSGVFLEAGSFTSNSSVQVNLDIPVGVADSTLYEGCGEARLQFIRPNESANIEETAYLVISGTAINGVDYVPALPDSVVFPVGVDTILFVLNAPNDANFEGEETVHIQITNIASDCSGAVVTSNFEFKINEADPLQVSGFDGALVDCHDEIELFPTISGGYGEYNYAWSSGQNSDLVTVSPGQTTTYFLVVSDTCSATSVQTSFHVDVPVYPPIQVDLGEDFEVAQCDVSIDIEPIVSGGFGAYHYLWTGNDELISNDQNLNYVVSESTNVQLVVTDDCQAVGTDNIMVTIPEVTVTAFLPDAFTATTCLDDILLPAISEGGIGQKTYIWTVDGVEQASTTQNFFLFNPSMGQNVVMTAIDECQNSASDSTVIAFDFPRVEITTSADTSICKNTTAELKVNVLKSSGGEHINWGGSDSSIYVVKPKSSQFYTVVVTDTCGMKAEGTVNVKIRDVKADFDYEYQPYYGIAFTNYSRAVEPTYFWDFGDKETSEAINPTHFYKDIIPYRVVLTVTDNIGCKDSVGLSTKPPLEIFIPTSFTPNGDGINDLFGVVANNVYEFEIQIFDRWGNRVFHSKDVSEKWNGSNKGNGYQSGAEVYNYLIRYKGEKEEDAIEKTGNITVIR